jgi:hypothetical protein
LSEKTKKQHYVPQSYLRNWDINKENGKKPKVFSYDIKQNNQFSVNIEDTAMKKYFYDYEKYSKEEIEIIYNNIPKKFQILKEDFLIKQGIEKLVFAEKIEKISIQTIISIIEKLEKLKVNSKENINKKNILSTTDKVILSYFISIQYIRTKKFRDESQKLYNESIEDINEKSKETINIEHIDDNENQFIHLRDMFYHANSIQRILLKYKWILYRNFTKVPYMTSDNPVVKKPNLKGIFDDYGIGSFGFESEGIEIRLPLSPKYELIIHEPIYLKKKHTKKFEKIHVIDNDVKNVLYSNALLIQFSNYLYSIENNFDVIKDAIRER